MIGCRGHATGSFFLMCTYNLPRSHSLSLSLSLGSFRLTSRFTSLSNPAQIRLRCMGKTTGAELLPALLPASNPLWSSSFVQAMARSTADAFTWGALVQW